MAVSQNLSIALAGQNVANNTSTVTITLTSTQTGASYNGYTLTGYYWISVNGGAETQYSFTCTLPKNSTTTCFSVNHTWTHNADGTGSISVRTSLATGISAGTVTTSKSYTPATIPRATQPSLSASSTPMGSAVTILTPRASGSFTHTLTYVFGGASGTIATGVGTSYAWTIPWALANQIPNATSGTGTIYCYTYNGNTHIGTKTINFTATVPATLVPSISAIELSDPTGNAAIYGAYVQNKSKIKVQVTASGSYSSTIRSVSITANGATSTANPYTSNVITASGGAKTVSVTVTDSRGRTATKTASYTVISYTSATVTSLSAFRCLSDGTEDEDGEYMNIVYAGSITALNNKNAKSFKVEYKEHNSTTWTTALTYTDSYTASGNVILEASTEKSYDVRFTVTDAFGASVSLATVTTAFTLIDLNESGRAMAIGKVSEIDNTFECALPMVGKKIITEAGTDLDAIGYEYGYNSNGYYKKYNDGTLVMWGYMTVPASSINYNAIGYENGLCFSDLITINYPYTPIAIRSGAVSAYNSGVCWTARISMAHTIGYFSIIQVGASVRDTQIQWVAYGNWR